MTTLPKTITIVGVKNVNGQQGDGEHDLASGVVFWATFLLMVWFAFGLCEIVLSLAMNTSMLNTSALAMMPRLTLLCHELALLAGAVGVIGLAAMLAFNLLKRRFSRSSGGKWIARVLAIAAIAGILFFWVGSWSTFNSTGRFVDAEAMSFVAQNTLQFFQHVAHMEPFVLLLIPIAVLAGAIFMTIVAPRLLRKLKRRHLLNIQIPLIVLLCVCIITAIAGRRIRPDNATGVADPNFGMVYTLGDMFSTCRDQRTGPLLHLWSTIRTDRTQPALADESLPVEWKAIIPMDEYLRRVDYTQLKRWNVIVILVESLRTDQLAVCGGRREVMPAAEAVARESRVFKNHYTQASHSNYADICPLSSHYPLRSPQSYIYPEKPAWPRVPIYDILKHLGYRTAVISSQNENWGGMINYFRAGGLDHLFHSETFEGPTYIPHDDTSFATFIIGEKRSGKIDDRFTVAEANRWIDGSDKPFFIYLNLQNSHVPYGTPADFPRRFGKKKLPFTIRFNSFPPEKRQEVMDVYADSLAYVDHQLGKLFEHLKSRGLWDKTVIILSGDTGQAFYEHGFASHANMLFNEVMQVPLIIRAPGMKHAISAQPAQHVDVPPTILRLLNLPPHPAFQGNDLLDPNTPKNRSIYLTAQCPLAHQYAIVRGGFKLIYDVRRKKHFLFNLKTDPKELKPLEKPYPPSAANLPARLDTWRKLQLDYYRNLHQHTKFYPPVLRNGSP